MLRFSHRRWTIPLLAELYRSKGSRVVTLVNRLGVSRQALRQTLDAGCAHRLIQPNPGYGHPLRPEYILTNAGATIAPACDAIDRLVKRRGLEETAYLKWSLPVLLALTAGPQRFSQLSRRLDTSTDRALTLALKDLTGIGLIDRFVLDTFPPATEYRLTDRAHRLAGAVGDLAERAMLLP